MEPRLLNQFEQALATEWLEVAEKSAADGAARWAGIVADGPIRIAVAHDGRIPGHRANTIRRRQAAARRNKQLMTPPLARWPQLSVRLQSMLSSPPEETNPRVLMLVERGADGIRPSAQPPAKGFTVASACQCQQIWLWTGPQNLFSAWDVAAE